jgi:nucleotide-binding universal stress UspA family protein
MYRYKRLMVGIEFGANDESTLRYAAMISRLAKSEKIYFVHVVRNLDNIPVNLLTEYLNSKEPMEEFVKHQMQRIVTKVIDGHLDSEVEYDVAEGSLLLELLRHVRQKGIDLLVIGKKPNDVSLPVKLARKASCSVLAVPRGFAPILNTILVAVDFSEHSRDAMEVGVAFAAGGGAQSIRCLHVYDGPTGYHKAGKTSEEFAGIMMEQVEKHFQEFIGTIDGKGLSVTPVFKLDQHKIPKVIEETIGENHVDLLVVGSRGRQTFAGLLLGSVTRELIKTITIPLIVVKKKG